MTIPVDIFESGYIILVTEWSPTEGGKHGKDDEGKNLDAALISFAENGYKGTNLRDLASGMGLTKSALYKHFASKEDIWNAMLDGMEAYYASHFGSPSNMPAVPQDAEDLKTLTLRMLDFTMRDEKIILTQKILLTEQFHDSRVRAIATEHFYEGIEALFTGIFAGMMDNGTLRRCDPVMLAFLYTAPISTLVQLCDREPQREAEILQKIDAFTQHFIDQYGIG